MKNLFASVGLAAAIGAAVLFFTACAQLRGGPAAPEAPGGMNREAQETLAGLARLNQKLHSFSGVGKLTAMRDGQVLLNERAAWVGSAPDKLSVVIFISGFPTLRFATDGKWLYLIEPDGNATVFRKARASDAAVARVIGVAISFADIVALLRGQVPVQDFGSVDLAGSTTAGADELVLRKWWGVIQKIGMRSGTGTPLKTERYDRTGTLLYRAVFAETMTVGSFRVPKRLVVLSDRRTQFGLTIDRYVPNVDVTPDMFVLKPIE